ncbi:MAG: putative sulfate exporter family transporter [Verrucomicrobia bacterium]|nr:putative sulfate exporter family transporter [Verrucomicrobiota bacterium]
MLECSGSIRLETSFRIRGLAFASKKLLRLGIVLLGTRLNFAVLAHAGPQVIAFDLLMIVCGISLITFVLRRTVFESTLVLLAAVGSSICEASAIAVAAPAERANKENSALAIVVCTLTGTAATFLFIPYSFAVPMQPI